MLPPTSEWATLRGGYNASLDGLRALAILLVMFMHGLHYSMRADSPITDVFVSFALMGWSGVDLFFVLSGFLITGILWRTKTTSTYFKIFYLRRIVRIFPLYYAVLAFFIILIPLFPFFAEWDYFWWKPPEERTSLWYWTYLSNYYEGYHGPVHRFLIITWSLAIEEQFYLLWPFLVYFLDRRPLITACIVVIAAVNLLRVIYVPTGEHVLPIYFFTHFRLDGLAMGSLLALLGQEMSGKISLYRISRVTLPLSLSAIIVLCTWMRLTTTDPEKFHMAFYFLNPLFQLVGYPLLTIFYGSVLIYTLCSAAGSTVHRLLTIRGLVTVGRYSYAIYLFHVPVFWALHEVFPPTNFPAQMLSYAVGMGATILLAWGSWHLFEKHFLALKKYFPYENEQKGSGVAA